MGDMENGSGIIIYADTQFMATRRAIFVISEVLLREGLFVTWAPSLF